MLLVIFVLPDDNLATMNEAWSHKEAKYLLGDAQDKNQAAIDVDR